MVFRRNTQDDPQHVLENKEMLNEWQGTLKTKTKTKTKKHRELTRTPHVHIRDNLGIKINDPHSL